jgi:hypothetical protein
VLCLAALWPAVRAAAQQSELAEHRVTIREREVVAPADARLVLRHGSRVRILWHSDESAELHVHGYDIYVKVEAGAVSVTEFAARATGRYPVTVHEFSGERAARYGHRALLHIEVHPR